MLTDVHVLAAQYVK